MLDMNTLCSAGREHRVELHALIFFLEFYVLCVAGR